MTNTPRLAMPLLAAGQAQKHVTLNDSLLRLDTVVQLAVLDRNLSTPPVSPAANAAYIVGASPTGAWAGKANAIAIFIDGFWTFEIPLAGWRAWLVDETIIAVYDGTQWIGLTDTVKAGLVGINATADSGNRLAVSSPATLLTHDGGGHQLKINKASAGDTGSLLFQTAYSGRAEMGLSGSDGFSLKVSANGTAWSNALTIDPANGRMTLTADATVAGHRIGMGNNAVATNIGFGTGILNAITSGAMNVAIGINAAFYTTSGTQNVAIGRETMRNNQAGSNNTALGAQASYYATSAQNNVCIGFQAGYNVTTGGSNTALGANSLASVATWTNCSGVGRNADVTGSNQVQLGDSATTVYAYGAVQNRSDARDKADIRDTELGLSFILRLRPRDFRWDMRDDYRDDAPASEPQKKGSRNSEGGEALPEGRRPRKLGETARSGTRKRSRFHHGLIAQEVQATISELGIDFGGLQDHASGGGDAVMTLGYTELIGPLIKAVQELSAKVDAAAAR
jgi:hypothetical protein